MKNKQADKLDDSSHIQTLLGIDGKPAFVVIPYQHFIERYDASLALVPNEVLEFAKVNDVSAIRAWREHLKFSQGDLAAKLGVTTPAVSQFEVKGVKLRKVTIMKFAKAMGLAYSQLNW